MKRQKKRAKAGRPSIGILVKTAYQIFRDQRAYLRRRAIEEGRSVSEVLRDIIEKEMT